VEPEDPAIKEARRLRQHAEHLRQMLGSTMHGLIDDKAAAQRVTKAVADTLADIHRHDGDSSHPPADIS
jgi:hypothetical protein